MLRAYRERKAPQARGHRGRLMADPAHHPGPLDDRHQAQAARHAPRARACAASTTPSSSPTGPRSGAWSPGCRTSSTVEEELVRCRSRSTISSPPRVQEAAPARRPRHRRQGRQDRRPRHEGPGRPGQHQARLRGRPDPARPAHAQGQGLQEPVPGRVRGRQPRHARGVRRRRRGRPGVAPGRGAWSPSRAW